MTELSRAVFLSYASQGAAAARSICEALTATGLEVCTHRDAGLRWIKVDAAFESLRADSHHTTLLSKMNLPLTHPSNAPKS